MKNIYTQRGKKILLLINCIIAILYMFSDNIWIHRTVSLCAAVDIVATILILLISYFNKKSNALEKIGVWIFILPACVIPKLYGFNYLEPQTTLILLSSCIGGIVVILSYRTGFHKNLIEGILIFGIFFIWNNGSHC